MTKIVLTNEIGGAVVSNDGDMAALAADPKAYIFSTFSVDLGDSSVSVVENSGDSVNLALPYYSGLDQMTSQSKSDDDLADISGGEVFITLALLCTAAGTAVAAVTAGAAVGGTHAAMAARGKNLDGSPRKGGKK